MHNYTARTSITLAVNTTVRTLETWQITVPAMAFEAPCLMDAVLAVSALHLRVQNPEDHTLVRASHGYMASAISQHMSCLKKGVDASNAEALFTTSALIAFQASASRRFQADDMKSQDSNGSYTLPTGWFHAFQGVKVMVLASWKWLRESERVRPIIQAQPALALDFSSDHPKFFDFLLEGLEEQLVQIEEPLRVETRQAYEHAVAYLNWTHPQPDRARILGFPATVSQRFVKLIDQEDPRALVIISCFFAMTKIVDDVWWLEGVARLEVSGILSLIQSEWKPKMDWAIKIAYHEGPVDDETWGGSRTSPGEIKSEVEDDDGTLHAHIDILASLTPALD
jgi:Fungal specific transcription factor domain